MFGVPAHPLSEGRLSLHPTEDTKVCDRHRSTYCRERNAECDVHCAIVPHGFEQHRDAAQRGHVCDIGEEPLAAEQHCDCSRLPDSSEYTTAGSIDDTTSYSTSDSCAAGSGFDFTFNSCSCSDSTPSANSDLGSDPRCVASTGSDRSPASSAGSDSSSDF